MIQVAWIRIGLALGAMVLFAIRVRTGDDNLRWVAIALLAVALLLRLAGRRRERPGGESSTNDGRSHLACQRHRFRARAPPPRWLPGRCSRSHRARPGRQLP